MPNELKVHEKTARTEIKQDSSPDFKTLDLRYMGRFRKQTNATFHPNIGSLKIAVEEEWNKISEGFILKAYKSFWKRVDTISEKKNGGHID